MAEAFIYDHVGTPPLPVIARLDLAIHGNMQPSRNVIARPDLAIQGGR